MTYRVDTDKTWHETYTELERAFSMWGVRDWSAEANVPRARVKTLAKSAHPDVGGSDEAMAALLTARERVLAELAELAEARRTA